MSAFAVDQTNATAPCILDLDQRRAIRYKAAIYCYPVVTIWIASALKQTILVVDDEAAVRKLLRRCFEREQFSVLEASCGDEMRRHLDTCSIDLITLDLRLADEDGLDLAREIRSSTDIPVIMVSGKGDLIDTVVGLEVGADDYISKPFELREVIARVRAVLRRYNRHEPAGNMFGFDRFELNTASRELQDEAGQLLALTTTEYDLLAVFVGHPRQVLNRDQLMDHLKGSDWQPNDRTIDNQVAKLRKKLRAADDATTMIKTVRGSGYMFTPEVKRLK